MYRHPVRRDVFDPDPDAVLAIGMDSSVNQSQTLGGVLKGFSKLTLMVAFRCGALPPG
jgi:hypothetical protein